VSGAFRKFLSPTTAASTGTLPAGTTAASGIGIPGTGISVSGLVTSAVNALLGMLGLGSLKDMAERAGLIILGFALVILGIHLLASGSGGSSKSQPVVVNEGDTKTTTSKPVSEGKTTSRRAVAKTGASEAVEAAAIA
jgi:hypothetical protein